MQKVGDITSTATPEGEFTDGNVAGGVNPTLLMALWFNTIQRELCNVVTGSGGELDPNNFTQILEAIRRVAQGAIPTGLVKSVNTKKPDANGNISLTAGDITGSVTSVNTKTGAVVLSASDVSAISSLGGAYNVLLKLARVETLPTENNVSALYNLQGTTGALVSGVEFNWYGNKFNIGITRDDSTGTNGLVFQHNGFTRLRIDKDGNLISVGEISSGGKIVAGAGVYDTPGIRVYSSNNPPPQQDLSSYARRDSITYVGLESNNPIAPYVRQESTNAIIYLAGRDWVNGNFLTGVRLGAQAWANNNNSGWAMAPDGAVLTGSYQDANYTAVYYRYPQYRVNGTWYNIGVA